MPTLECAPQIGAEENGENMFWLNLDTAIATRPEFFRSPPLDRATWLALMFYCAINENGGRIPGCKAWGDDTWQQGARLRRREVHRPSALWMWEGDDLVVTYYPIQQEEKVRRKRETGKQGADARWTKNPGNRHFPDSIGNGSGIPGCHGSPQQPGDTEGNSKGRECKGTEGEGNQPFPPTLEEAIRLGEGLDAEFIRKEWLAAMARGGCDWKMRPIPNWPAYLQLQKDFRESKPADPARAGGALPAWRRLKSLEAELEDVKAKLRLLPRFNPNINPEEFQNTQEKAAPLRARREELERLIREIQQQQG